MTEEMHLLGESDDYPDLAHLPPKERARIRRLRDWLAARSWKPEQAMAVLCGYDPEVGRNTCAADMSFLPGADDFYRVPFGSREPDDLRELDAGLEEQHGYIGGLRLITMPPKEMIAKALLGGVKIPWLKIARADPECLKYLPPEALDDSADAPRVSRTASEVASLGGKAKRDKDPKRQRFFPIVLKLHQAEVKTAEIVRQLLDMYGDEPDENLPSSATVYRWVGEIKTAAKAQKAES